MRFLSTVPIVLMIAACATGRALKEQSPAFPALETGQARVYFYRTSVVGGASELAVSLNGQQVGNAIPRSVFFRDVAPGKYSVTTAMSSQVVKFELAAGDKKYVRLSYGFSFNTYPELVDSATGEAESSGLSHIRFAVLPIAGHGAQQTEPQGFDWSLLNGNWAESTRHQFGCRAENLHQRFELSSDKKTLTFRNDRKWEIGTGQAAEQYSASVLHASPNVLIIRYGPELPGISEEMRQWEMRFIGPGTYRWRATAWREGVYNDVIGVRCS